VPVEAASFTFANQ
jgi:hypothetical protein